MKAGLLAFAVTAALAMPAHAQQPPCGSADSIVATITGQKYSETGMLELMAGPNRLQLFSNAATGTWSLIAYQPNGMACIVAAGNSIEPMGQSAKKPKGPEL